MLCLCMLPVSAEWPQLPLRVGCLDNNHHHWGLSSLCLCPGMSHPSKYSHSIERSGKRDTWAFGVVTHMEEEFE